MSKTGNAIDLVQFQRVRSAPSIGFWKELQNLKLNEWHLNSAPVRISASFTTPSHAQVSSPLLVDEISFDPDSPLRRGYIRAPGTLLNVNTREEFRDLRVKSLLDETSLEIWNDIHSGNAFATPSLLIRFHLITFADLKNHSIHYWFCMPALKTPYTLEKMRCLPFSILFPSKQHQITSLITAWFSSHPTFACVLTPTDSDYTINPLSDWTSSSYLVFLDTCPLPDHPGWMLRNLLTLLLYHFPTTTTVRILCWRSAPLPNARSSAPSVVLEVRVQGDPLKEYHGAVGWEKNSAGKLAPRLIDLHNQLDPITLAKSSADLNLRLITWRQLPGLNLDMLKSTKCLLLGAGTLGCSVARLLMAWGLTKLTLVDNGTVSYSNPLRQNLYMTEDCKDGGRPKAIVAAERLAQIYPAVEAVGIQLSIPMVGHPITDTTQFEKEFTQLQELIQDHDVILLMTDTRESRWLPTLMATAYDKLLLNVALGFSTFVVMRHGTRLSAPEQRLGCYFCSDVFAPSDSLQRRTLDQQCTVTRAGVASLASSVCVELLCSLLHHPLREKAPADQTQPIVKALESPFGLLPHQIRGWLTHFHMGLFSSQAFSSCTACSPSIVTAYLENPSEFVRLACGSPSLLEDISGLTRLKQVQDELNWDDDEIE